MTKMLAEVIALSHQQNTDLKGVIQRIISFDKVLAQDERILSTSIKLKPDR
jgi:hypothetical protein